MMRLEVFRLATDTLQYLDTDGLGETVLNIAQIKTSLEEEMQDLPYARPDGLYPDMTVGAVIGADETAQWAQRETESSGTATVRSVQGAAVVWNQLVQLIGGTSTVVGTVTRTASGGKITLDGTAVGTGSNQYVGLSGPINIVSGHKYLLTKRNDALNFYVAVAGSNTHITNTSSIFTATSDASGTYIYLVIPADGYVFDNYECWPQLFDLTTMFGSGNEPNTVAEFEAMYPAAYYPYSAPTLKPVRIAGIASTDANGNALDSVEWETQTLRAAGSIRDELTAGELVTRVGQCVIDGVNVKATSIAAPSGSNTTYRCAVPLPFGSITITSDYYNAFNASHTFEFSLNTLSALSWANGDAMLYQYDGPTLLCCLDGVTTTAEANAWFAVHPVTLTYPVTVVTQPISPALPMTYKVQQGGSESIIVPDGEVSAAPVLTVAEPVNAGDEFARIWAAIESLGYTRNTAQLSRPVSLTDIGSIDEVQKDTTDVVEIETTKEVQE